MSMTLDDAKRVIDQNVVTTIAPEDSVLIDSVANGTRRIKYEDLCNAVKATLEIESIKTAASGAMQKSEYDPAHNGTVDNSEALEGHKAAYFAKASDLTSVRNTADTALQKDTEYMTEDELTQLLKDITQEDASQPINLWFMTGEEVTAMWNDIKTTAEKG